MCTAEFSFRWEVVINIENNVPPIGTSGFDGLLHFLKWRCLARPDAGPRKCTDTPIFHFACECRRSNR